MISLLKVITLLQIASWENSFYQSKMYGTNKNKTHPLRIFTKEFQNNLCACFEFSLFGYINILTPQKLNLHLMCWMMSVQTKHTLNRFKPSQLTHTHAHSNTNPNSGGNIATPSGSWEPSVLTFGFVVGELMVGEAEPPLLEVFHSKPFSSLCSLYHKSVEEWERQAQLKTEALVSVQVRISSCSLLSAALHELTKRKGAVIRNLTQNYLWRQLYWISEGFLSCQQSLFIIPPTCRHNCCCSCKKPQCSTHRFDGLWV